MTIVKQIKLKMKTLSVLILTVFTEPTRKEASEFLKRRARYWPTRDDLGTDEEANLVV